MLALGLLAAVVAAVANSGAALLESLATRRASRPSRVVRSPVYLAGLALDLGAWVLTVIALRFLPIVAVQAVIAGQVALTVVASHWVFGTVLRRVDLAAALTMLVGLALLVGSTGAGTPGPVGTGAVVALAVVVALVGGTGVVTALRVRRGAVALAALSGLAFGATAVAVRLADLGSLSRGTLLPLLADPVVWSLLVSAGLGLGLYTVALGRGAVGPVVAVLAVVETVAPGLVGLALLGDSIRPGWTLGFVVGLALALGGVVVLARSPAQVRLAADDGVAGPGLKRP